MRQEFHAFDAHVGGAPVRLLASGVPRPSGATMARRRTWLQRQADHVRRATMLEPRGHRDLVGVLLTEPVTPGADAGLLFLDAGGYPALNGAAVIAAATIALERGLITKVSPDASDSETVRLAFDTPAGTVIASAKIDAADGKRVTSVAVTGVPSFVTDAGCEVSLASRRLRVDLAYGGAFYAIVDSEAVGIPLALERLSDLRRLGADLCAALDGHESLVHPGEPAPATLTGAIFTGPPQGADAHLRSVTVVGHGGCDRSPGVTGTAAVMAVLDAMGLLQEGEDFVHEGLLGLAERGHIVRHTRVGDVPAMVPQVSGTSWTVSEHMLIVEAGDPLRDGFSL